MQELSEGMTLCYDKTCYAIQRQWRGGRVVYGSGLENRRACKGTVGSNPTLSAIPSTGIAVFLCSEEVNVLPYRTVRNHARCEETNHDFKPYIPAKRHRLSSSVKMPFAFLQRAFP